MANKRPITLNSTSLQLEELQPDELMEADLLTVHKQLAAKTIYLRRPATALGGDDDVNIFFQRDLLRTNYKKGHCLKIESDYRLRMWAIEPAGTMTNKVWDLVNDLMVLYKGLLTESVVARNLQLQGNPASGAENLGGNSAVSITMTTADGAGLNSRTFRTKVANNPTDANNAAYSIEALDIAGNVVSTPLQLYHDGRIRIGGAGRGGGLFIERSTFCWRSFNILCGTPELSGTVNSNPQLTIGHTESSNIGTPDKRAFQWHCDPTLSVNGQSVLTLRGLYDNLNAGSDLVHFEYNGLVKVAYGMTVAFGVNDAIQGNNYRLQVNSQIWASNATIATNSDRRLKSNINRLQDGALKVVNEFIPCTYDKTINGETHFEVGFVAQEAAEALNGQAYKDCIVHTPALEDEMYSMSPGALIPVMVKAIQELTAEVAVLREEVAELKRRPL